MFPGAIQTHLDDLSQAQSQIQTVQRQISSGLQVQFPSDAPFGVGSILDTQTRIANLQQNQTNLGNLQTELSAADAALQQATQVIDSAISSASQASNPLTPPSTQTALIAQVQGMQQTLVNLATTTADGRYIFSGDADQQAMYKLDATQPNGVRQLVTANSTRVVNDANGNQVWVSQTAQQIFDARNPDGTPAAGNVFAAVSSLLAALQTNNTAAAAASVSSLQAASNQLNASLAYYGTGEARVADTLNAQSATLVTEQQSLGSQRDTNMASAAVEMTQLQTGEQATLASMAKFPPVSLFNFLA